MKKLVALILTLIMSLSLFAPALAENMDIDGVEVKFLLDPALVLDENNEIKPEVLDFLGFTGKVKNRGMMFVETEDKAYNEDGWCIRIRIKQGDDEYDVTYKKRYTVTDGDVEAALALAAADGFVDGLDDYEAELDWGHSKLTLSIATESSVDKVDYPDTTLPELDDAIAMVQDTMPDPVKAVEADITEGKLCGPVYYKRYTGELLDLELDIEIVPITSPITGETEIICEVAFSVDTMEEAAAKRDEMTKILDESGYLLKEDGLKTTRIINAYID